MQQILSQSSKVVVDGKAGNVLYLPLDKLAAISSQSTLAKDKVVNGDNLTSPGGDSSLLFDGREITRPTERQGRSN